MFVDIIHTDANGFGSSQATGSIDFWPNGGVHLQPGCPYTSETFDIKSKFLIFLFFWIFGFELISVFRYADFCSHVRSVEYYAESVYPKYQENFPAVRVANSLFNDPGSEWNEFKEHNIDESGYVYMGFLCPTNVSGSYFLQTNSKPWYGRGFDGLVYENEDDWRRTNGLYLPAIYFAFGCGTGHEKPNK